MVQIWISNLFLCHVFPNALEYRTCICRNPQLKTGSLPALDIFVPVFHPGVAQFAFGFYSVMLTSTVLGVATMILFKPRSWCVYCPMGTMTQLICKAKSPKLNDSK